MAHSISVNVIPMKSDRRRFENIKHTMENCKRKWWKDAYKLYCSRPWNWPYNGNCENFIIKFKNVNWLIHIHLHKLLFSKCFLFLLCCSGTCAVGGRRSIESYKKSADTQAKLMQYNEQRLKHRNQSGENETDASKLNVLIVNVIFICIFSLPWIQSAKKSV